MDPIPASNADTNLLTALIAGATAGAVQTTLTFPFEFVKTTSQIENLTRMSPYQLPVGIRPYFTGCYGLAIGNSLKAASRFLIFNQFTKFMANENGKTTAPRVVVAGLMTGFAETLWVIPFENIKTTMIQNSMILSQKSAKIEKPPIAKSATASADLHPHHHQQAPGVRSTKRPSTPQVQLSAKQQARAKAVAFYNANPQTTFTKVLKEIYQTRGLRGFTQGSIITLFRQSMNSMVWYSTYNSLQQLYSPNRSEAMSTFMLTSVGFLSSFAVIAATQPIDVMKTRMQTKDYKIVYKDIMTCIVKTFMNEGFSKMFAGWLPRLVKVSCSGSITLVTYEVMEKTLNLSMKENPFQAT